jgi:hypothetical protein
MKPRPTRKQGTGHQRETLQDGTPFSSRLVKSALHAIMQINGRRTNVCRGGDVPLNSRSLAVARFDLLLEPISIDYAPTRVLFGR